MIEAYTIAQAICIGLVVISVGIAAVMLLVGYVAKVDNKLLDEFIAEERAKLEKLTNPDDQ